jgi:hypothetical protein
MWWPNTTLLTCTRFLFFFSLSTPRPTSSLSLKSLYTHTHTCLITQPPAIFSFLPPLTNPIDGTKKKNLFPSILFMFSICFPCWIRFVSLRRKQGETISSLNEMGLLYPSHKKRKIPSPNGWIYLKRILFFFFAFQFFFFYGYSIFCFGERGISKKFHQI